MAAYVPNKHCSFNFVKNHKIAHNSTTVKAREKKYEQTWNL
jgi:hypothetical protein